MKVLVCGGRDYSDMRCVHRVLRKLDSVNSIDIIIHGDASGADNHGKTWGLCNKKEVIPYPAKWDDLSVPGAVIRPGKHGPYNVMAGYQRNLLMLTEERPDLVVAFPGGKGTAHTVKLTRELGIPVMEINDATIDS